MANIIERELGAKFNYSMLILILIKKIKRMNFKSFIQPARFLISGLALYFLWIIIYEGIIKPAGWIDPWLTNTVAIFSVKALSIGGVPVSQQLSSTGNYIISNNSETLLIIDYVCDGLELYIVFMIFICVFPGPSKHKIWFIPSGFIVIFLVNLLRVISLILIQIHSPQHLNFNHKYTFAIIIYSIIFLMWFYWANNISGIRTKKPAS
jgi:exosortase/archaeosortase family protein